MCLSTLDSPIKSEDGVGWKAFERVPGLEETYITPVRGFLISSSGQWVTDSNSRELPTDQSPPTFYPSGFHIFLKKEDAEAYSIGDDFVVKKVRYAKVVASGIQLFRTPSKCEDAYLYYYGPCVVAKEIMILPEEKS